MRDTGPGIAPEDQTRIFESFSQVDASISRKYGGTGLGLAISKSLAEQMGGSLRVESQLGKGATFHFTSGCASGSGSSAPADPGRQRTRPLNRICLRCAQWLPTTTMSTVGPLWKCSG